MRRRLASIIFVFACAAPALCQDSPCFPEHVVDEDLVHDRAPIAAPLPAAEREPRLPLVLEVVTLKSNGAETTVSEAFVDRITARLRSTELFSAVYGPREVNQAPAGAAVMRYEIDGRFDGNMGTAIAKGFLIGASLLILAPVLPLAVDKEGAMRCAVELPDGTLRRYRATTDATTWFHIFANAYAAGTELDATVTNSNFDSIVSQMKADAALVGGRCIDIGTSSTLDFTGNPVELELTP